MKHLDLTSLLVAGMAGALLLLLVIELFDTTNNNRTNYASYLLYGFVVGMGVQVAERFTGAS